MDHAAMVWMLMKAAVQQHDDASDHDVQFQIDLLRLIKPRQSRIHSRVHRVRLLVLCQHYGIHRRCCIACGRDEQPSQGRDRWPDPLMMRNHPPCGACASCACAFSGYPRSSLHTEPSLGWDRQVLRIENNSQDQR